MKWNIDFNIIVGEKMEDLINELLKAIVIIDGDDNNNITK